MRPLVACDKDLQSIVVEAGGDTWPRHVAERAGIVMRGQLYEGRDFVAKALREEKE